MKNVEPLIVKTMLQSKLKSDSSFPGRYFPGKVLLKNMIVDTTLKLTQKDWIKEQVDDVDLNKIIKLKLLKSNRLNTYMTQEMDSPAIQIMLRCKKDLILRNGLLYWRTNLKNHLEPVVQFVLPKGFICKVILACHDDNGHLGTEQTLGSGPKWQKMYKHISILVRGV